MPRNPKVGALAKARACQANWEAAQRSIKKMDADRKAVMRACRKAGCTINELTRIFKCSYGYVWQATQDEEDVA
jgi:hypothetical protein